MSEQEQTQSPRATALTLGCKVNQYESACMLSQLTQQGYEIVPANQDADVVIVNTCTVTGRADFKSRNLIRRLLRKKKKRPWIRIVVTGCYAQRFPKEIRALGDVDILLDNDSKHLLTQVLAGAQPPFSPASEHQVYREQKAKTVFGRSRAFVKIQDGCDRFCTYCAVPLARGVSRDRSVNDILEQARILTDNGCREIVLCGVNLGLWGRQGDGLSSLLCRLDQIDDLRIVRLSSIEPDTISLRLIETATSLSSVAHHWHIPLQSGSDRILKRMGRRYDVQAFRVVVAMMRRYMPDAALGFDVITGFPGETENDFLATRDVLEELHPAYLHVFVYSERPGTAAAGLREKVHGAVAQERSEILRELDNRLRKRYLDHIITCEVPLRGIREETAGTLPIALSDHFVRIFTQPENVRNGIISGIPVRLYEDGILVQTVNP